MKSLSHFVCWWVVLLFVSCKAVPNFQMRQMMVVNDTTFVNLKDYSDDFVTI
jgi:hypothetical protein